jgi:hypothetical protein
MADQYFADLAKLDVNGRMITIGSASNWARAWKDATAPATWANPEFDKPVSYKDSVAVPYSDLDDHADLDFLQDIEESKLAVPIIVYPQGNAAGIRCWAGTCVIKTTGIDVGIDKPAGGTVTFNFKGGLRRQPNIVLSALDFGSTGQGDASSFTAPTASGGAPAYVITMADEAGAASALPYGITWTGSAFTGTVNAAAPLGKYRVRVKVVDDDSVTRYFDAVMTVVA